MFQNGEKIQFTDIHDRYEIVKKLGEGMYARTYKALNLQNQRFYTLKVLHGKNVVSEKELEKDYKNEIRILHMLKAKLGEQCKNRFPFIVDSFPYGTKYVIITEYLEGVTLESIVPQHGFEYMLQTQRGRNFVGEVMLKLIETLELLHNCSIVHRDLKADNILISNVKNQGDCSVNVSIIDFGFGCTLKEAENPENHIVGSIVYRAPEVFQYRMYGRKSDIYATGILIYYLLTKEDLLYNAENETGEEDSNVYIENLMNNTSKLPIFVQSMTMKFLIQEMTHRNPMMRLSCQDAIRMIEDFMKP